MTRTGATGGDENGNGYGVSVRSYDDWTNKGERPWLDRYAVPQGEVLGGNLRFEKKLFWRREPSQQTQLAFIGFVSRTGKSEHNGERKNYCDIGTAPNHCGATELIPVSVGIEREIPAQYQNSPAVS